MITGSLNSDKMRLTLGEFTVEAYRCIEIELIKYQCSDTNPRNHVTQSYLSLVDKKKCYCLQSAVVFIVRCAMDKNLNVVLLFARFYLFFFVTFTKYYLA